MKKRNITFEQIEGTLQLKSWWAVIAILPFARRMIYYLVNYTNIKPNTITFISILIRFLSCLFFLKGTYIFLVLGGTCFQIAYLLDCIDGPIARLTNQTSTFGRYFDHMSDMLCGVFILLSFSYGQGLFLHPIIIAIIFVYISEYYITYLVNFVLECSIIKKIASSNIFIKYFLKYRRFFFDKHLKSFVSLPDCDALLFFVFPILGMPKFGFYVYFYLIIIITLYKIFSSFISIHTEDKIFP